MTKKERDFYQKRYAHVNLWFAHGEGWDELTLAAAQILDGLWPAIPFWLKHMWANFIGKGVYLKHPKLQKLFHIPDKPAYFEQIKEKFGNLRLYCIPYLSSISALEFASYMKCEKCGTRKEIGHTTGWIKTLCKKCAIEKTGWHPIKITIISDHTYIEALNKEDEKSKDLY